MNKDIFQGHWNEIKGSVKEKWGKLTDNDLTQVDGRRDQLLGVIQKRYGYAKEQAEQELRNFEDEIEFSDINEGQFDDVNEGQFDDFNKRKTGTEDF